MAQDYGYKNAGVARNKFQAARNKHKAIGDTSNGAAPPNGGPKLLKGSTTKRKAVGEAKVGATKRGRKLNAASTSTVSTTATQDSTEEDDDEGLKTGTDESIIKKDEDDDAEDLDKQDSAKIAHVRHLGQSDEEA